MRSFRSAREGSEPVARPRRSGAERATTNVGRYFGRFFERFRGIPLFVALWIVFMILLVWLIERR